MVIINIILYVQLAATITVETFGKMTNAMRPLIFFNNMADPRVILMKYSRKKALIIIERRRPRTSAVRRERVGIMLNDRWTL